MKDEGRKYHSPRREILTENPTDGIRNLCASPFISNGTSGASASPRQHARRKEKDEAGGLRINPLRHHFEPAVFDSTGTGSHTRI
jgi:hypothetical protein